MSHNDLFDLLSNEKIQLLSQRAEEHFRSGLNCCESMLKASIEVLELPLPEKTYLLGKFFREGIAGSGCVCGALAGGTMILGFLYGETKEGLALAKSFREQFVQEFGSSCCRVLRKKQSFVERLSRSQCRRITGFSALTLSRINEEMNNRNLGKGEII